MRVALAALICFLMFTVGCQRVSQQKTEALEAMEVKAPFIVDGPSSEQNVTVAVSPEKGSPVDVFIVLEKDRQAVTDDLQNGREPKKTLGGQRKIENDTTVTAKVPAKSEYAVIVGNSRKATKVTLKLDGR